MRIPVSKARARLFELAELVKRGDDTVVVLEQRGSAEGVALVREARLNYLEDRVKQMDETPAKVFRVAGSLSSPLDDEEVTDLLAELRKAWTTSPTPTR
jgi:hypothetical protein